MRAVDVVSMKPYGWRAFLLSLCVAAAVLTSVDFVNGYVFHGGRSLVGQWGDTVTASAVPYHLAVLSIDPGHGADLAGLRAGDLIDIRRNTPVERFWLFGQPPTGRAVTMLSQRGASQRDVTVVPESIAQQRAVILSPIFFGYFWIALFAAVIAWRRSDDVQMRTLCLLLVAYAMSEVTNEHFVTSSSPWLLTVAAMVSVLGSLTAAFWAACAGSFGSHRSLIRRLAQWLCYCFVAAAVVVGLLKIVGIITLWVDPVAFYSMVAGLPFAFACLAAIVCTYFAIAETRAAEQQRAIWSLVPSAVLIIVAFGAEYLQGVLPSYDLAWGAYYLAMAVNVSVPLALTYVALNRRLLDIGFVLNRAAVFAIVSTVLILGFVIVEWIANEWLNASHASSAIVGMTVALAIGLSIRYVHRFAERFVDRVLFRSRYEAEAALRRFAHEAGFITDRSTLLDRTLSIVRTSTGTDASIVTLDDGTSGIDENDPALVSLRAWHRPVDLERFPDSALHGQFAFPMTARGQLVGALICGTKTDSEAYAPDEAEALQLVADGVGSALGVLGHSGAGANGSLAGEIALLRATILELRELKA